MAERILLSRVPYYYCNENLGKPFKMILMGVIPVDAQEYVSVNLCILNGSQFPNINIPFHLSIRPSIPELVRNTYFTEKNVWQANEEKQLMCDTFPINRGSSFQMELLCNEKEIVGTFNGKCAFKFAHKGDAKQINLLEIHGPIYIDSINFDFMA